MMAILSRVRWYLIVIYMESFFCKPENIINQLYFNLKKFKKKKK